MDSPKDKRLAASIGVSARQARLARELTQADIAERIGLSPEFYARIERGHALPSVPTLVRIGAALDLGMDELMGRIDRAPADVRAGGPEKNANGHWTNSPISNTPDVRRLVRRLKNASPATLRMVALLVKELGRKQE